jgi:hypothetical protein
MALAVTTVRMAKRFSPVPENESDTVCPQSLDAPIPTCSDTWMLRCWPRPTPFATDRKFETHGNRANSGNGRPGCDFGTAYNSRAGLIPRSKTPGEAMSVCFF